MREDDFAASFPQVQFCLDAAVRRAAAKQMIQKERAVFFRDVKRKRLADQAIARATEKLRCGEVDLSNSTDTVETDISDRRELEKIDIALDGRFKFRFRMLEDWCARGLLRRAISPSLPITRKFSGRARRCFHFVHVRPY